MDVNMKYVLSVINELRDEWYKPPSGTITENESSLNINPMQGLPWMKSVFI